MSEFVPRPYQQDGSEHLLENNYAGLFMGCGLGKTGTTLFAINHLFEEFKTFGVLIVAPVRVCNWTWEAEKRKWSNFNYMRIANLRTKEGLEHLKNRTAHIYIINYEALPRFQKTYLKGRRAKQYAFDMVVFDESTMAKNEDSIRIRSARQYFWKYMRRRWLLTGEPTPNSMMEIFGQMLLMDAGERLGRFAGKFRDRYFSADDWIGRDFQLRPGAKEQIYEKIGDVCLTIKTSDHLDAPDMSVEDIFLDMPNEAWDHYQEMKSDLITVHKAQVIVAANGAVAHGKLCQITGGAAYDKEGTTAGLHNSKFEALKKLVKKHKKEPVLVMFAFRFEAEEIRKLFPKAKFMDDFKGPNGQQELETNWNAGKYSMLVGNPKSMAHGLNLQHGGRVIVWMTPPPSGEQYNQANHRLWRSGQERPVIVYRLLIEGSVDELVTEKLRNKAMNSNDFLEALKRTGKNKSIFY